MKLTNSIFQTNNEGKCPFMDSFNAIMDQDMGIASAMNLLSIGTQLDAQNAKYAKLRMRLFKKYGEPVEGDGWKIRVRDENVPSFMEEMNELSALEFEVIGDPVNLSAEKVTLKATDLIRLRPILAGVPEIPVPSDSETDS